MLKKHSMITVSNEPHIRISNTILECTHLLLNLYLNQTIYSNKTEREISNKIH